MQLSRLNANCRHPFVACEGSGLADSPIGHYNRNVWTAGMSVNSQINKDSLLCPRISFNVIYFLSTFGVFQNLQCFLKDSLFQSKISDRFTRYWAVQITWILQPGRDINQIKTCGIFMLILHFWQKQNVGNFRYYKKFIILTNCIVKLECSWIVSIKYKVPLLVTKNLPLAGNAIKVQILFVW